MPESTLNSTSMQTLLQAVEEASRSTEKGVKYFVEPAEGTLARVMSRRHHLVFGRRGSGKSSLLRKAQAELTLDRRPISYVDLETYKGHAYPDVLLSVLISTFEGFSEWLGGPAINLATKRSFWQKYFGRTPVKSAYDRKQCTRLREKINGYVAELRKQLHSVDDASVELATSEGAQDENSLGFHVPQVGLKACSSSTRTSTQQLSEQYRRSKIDFLHRHIIDYQAIFAEMAEISSDDAYLFLDDLYHIRRSDQPSVIDYFHRIAKSGGLWLKVGTVRHRSEWYQHRDPPIGVKLGDDADEVNLDLTLEKYPLAKGFLNKVLSNFSEPLGLRSQSSFLTDDALDRLVLASGGVARDFLTIFRRSITQARQRGPQARGGDKIGVEDVNVAAGEHDSAKREEFKSEAGNDQDSLSDTFEKVRGFCLDETKSNCFLVSKDANGPQFNHLRELVDLKLLHLVRSRVTVSGRAGEIYEAYMLDVSQYAGTRKRRGLKEIQFWKDDQMLRRASLIFDVSGGYRQHKGVGPVRSRN